MHTKCCSIEAPYSPPSLNSCYSYTGVKHCDGRVVSGATTAGSCHALRRTDTVLSSMKAGQCYKHYEGRAVPHHFVDVELERRVVVGPRLVQVDEEEQVGPLVVLFLHVLLKAL